MALRGQALTGEIATITGGDSSAVQRLNKAWAGTTQESRLGGMNFFCEAPDAGNTTTISNAPTNKL